MLSFPTAGLPFLQVERETSHGEQSGISSMGSVRRELWVYFKSGSLTPGGVVSI